MTFEARFASVCERCGEPIVRGDKIERAPGTKRYQHASLDHCDDLRSIAESDAIQRQEMRMETFAAESLMGMRPGTTEGWYDEPDYPDLDDQREPW